MAAGQHWVDTGWFLRPGTGRNLFAAIGAIGGASPQTRFAWRGMSSIDYELVSSSQRTTGFTTETELREQELRILSEAREWGLGYGPGGWATDHQLLADLQHYGTATRFIDVTSNPMTALWFACQTPVRGADTADLSDSGVILAINISSWTRFGRSQPASTRAAADDPLGWELREALQQPEPFVVESLLPNDRLRAQDGFFIAGQVPDAANQLGPFKSLTIPDYPSNNDYLASWLVGSGEQDGPWSGEIPYVAVEVPAELKAQVLQHLESSFNRHPRVLFPDFGGFLTYGSAHSPRGVPQNLERNRRPT
jgi:hypothetical protein